MPGGEFEPVLVDVIDVDPVVADVEAESQPRREIPLPSGADVEADLAVAEVGAVAAEAHEQVGERAIMATGEVDLGVEREVVERAVVHPGSAFQGLLPVVQLEGEVTADAVLEVQPEAPVALVEGARFSPRRVDAAMEAQGPGVVEVSPGLGAGG